MWCVYADSESHLHVLYHVITCVMYTDIYDMAPYTAYWHKEPKRDERRAKRDAENPMASVRKSLSIINFLRGSMSALSFPKLPGYVKDETRGTPGLD